MCVQTFFLKNTIISKLFFDEGRPKSTKLRPWVRWNCPTTDETFPFGCVKRPLGRSWVLSQFANSVLSFVTVELLITIPHSSPPSYPPLPPSSLPRAPPRPANPLVCLVSATVATKGLSAFVLSLSFSLSLRFSPRMCARIYATHFTLAFRRERGKANKNIIFNCDFNCFPFAPRTIGPRFPSYRVIEIIFHLLRETRYRDEL